MRDPFARESTYRRLEKGASCAFCGQQSGPRRDGSWRYRVETDGGRTIEDARTFCGKECREAWTR